MAQKRYGHTVAKVLIGLILAVLAYAGLEYGAALGDMDKATAMYGTGDIEGALNTFERVEARLRSHGALRLIPSGDRQTLLLNEARLLYALNRFDQASERLAREDEISGVATDGRFFLVRGQIGFRRAIQAFQQAGLRGGAPAMDASHLAEDLNVLQEGLLVAEDNFRESLRLNPNDWDAKYNFEFVDNMRKATGSSVQENLKFLKEGEQAPTTELPPNRIS